MSDFLGETGQGMSINNLIFNFFQLTGIVSWGLFESYLVWHGNMYYNNIFYQLKVRICKMKAMFRLKDFTFIQCTFKA